VTLVTILYLEGWVIVGLALVTSGVCLLDALHLRNSRRVICFIKSYLCLVLAIFLGLGLARVLNQLTTLVLVLACLAGLLLAMIARERVERSGDAKQ